LLAVDLTTGAVRSEYRFPLDAAGLVAPRAIRLAGDRVLVTLHRGVDTSEESSRAAQVPWLARFDPDLRLVDEIPLAEAGSTAFEEALAVDDAGTAYVGLVVGEFETPGVEARLVQLPIDATTATTVATFPGDDLIDGLAVDPAGEWAYLAGLDDGEEEFTATVTAIDLTGERDPVTRSYCESTHVVGPSITPDGRSLVFAAACRGRPTLAQLFTLR
jgi:hypothetical protein